MRLMRADSRPGGAELGCLRVSPTELIKDEIELKWLCQSNAGGLQPRQFAPPGGEGELCLGRVPFSNTDIDFINRTIEPFSRTMQNA